MHIEPWVAPSGRQRLLIRLEPAAERRYARAAELAFPLGPRAPRSFGSAPRAHRPPPVGRELTAFRRAVGKAMSEADMIEVGDVAACYGSIRSDMLATTSRALGGDPTALLACLRPVWDRGVVTGLPIGPDPSSYVADRVLSLADRAAARAGVLPFRWVDDVVFVGDPDAVARSARAWRHALGELGLVAHDGKRRVGRVRDVLDGPPIRSSYIGASARGIIRLA